MDVIQVEDVWKKFHLNGTGNRKRHLRDLTPALLRRRSGSVFWALKGISFSVAQGETVAMVGPNGSGKSTLLRLITGVLHPSRGRVRVTGRICPLIELGAGFHHDLRARDNVYLNGIVLGLTRHELDQAYDAIVEFAELGEFMELPLKRLSSGMQMRLGFSVAVHARPDILVVDEVLSVGDAAFQSKCFDWLAWFQRNGGTILFVSHDQAAVYRVSDRILHLRDGRIVEEEVITGRECASIPSSRPAADSA